MHTVHRSPRHNNASFSPASLAPFTVVPKQKLAQKKGHDDHVRFFTSLLLHGIICIKHAFDYPINEKNSRVRLGRIQPIDARLVEGVVQYRVSLLLIHLPSYHDASEPNLHAKRAERTNQTPPRGGREGGGGSY